MNAYIYTIILDCKLKWRKHEEETEHLHIEVTPLCGG